MSTNTTPPSGTPASETPASETPPSGTPASEIPDVAVIGGGLAGLCAAATVARAGKSVTLYERRNDVGGQARSTIKDGFTLNQGPHALYRGQAAERILTDLGVKLDGAAPPSTGSVVFDGKSHIAPGGAVSLLRTSALGAGEKFEVAKTLGMLPRLDAAAHAGTTVNDWIESSVSRPRTRQLLHTLVRLATYTNQPDQLSAEVAIGQLQAALSAGVLYLHGGWQQLVDQLRAQPGISTVTGDAVTELPAARTVIVATGSPQAAGQLLGTTFDVGPAASVSCLDLGLAARPASDFLLGGDQPFYFSNHSAAARLAPAGQYHAAAVQYLADGDEPDVERLEAFAAISGFGLDDVISRRHLHRMTTVTAIATASRGGLAGRPTVSDTDLPDVFIAGDWVGPEGHLADASVASGHAAAKAALVALSSPVRADRPQESVAGRAR